MKRFCKSGDIYRLLICYHYRPIEDEVNTSAKRLLKKKHAKLKKRGEASRFASRSKRLKIRNPKLHKLSSARLAAYGVSQ